MILTKADLATTREAQVEQAQKIAGGADVIALSSHTGLGLDRLGQYLQPGKTAVFLGMSGVGKSSLLNALAGEQRMAVKEIREQDARGRHTTTHRQLILLPSGAMVIDTPGMRELGLWNAEEGISAAFGDVEDLIARCRFSDCRHRTEPGCAVLAALAEGRLSSGQWESCQKQKAEAAFVARKTSKNRNKG